MTNEKQVATLEYELTILGETLPAAMPRGTDERQAQYKEMVKLARTGELKIARDDVAILYN